MEKKSLNNKKPKQVVKLAEDNIEVVKIPKLKAEKFFNPHSRTYEIRYSHAESE